jgi:hypothetical protein
LHECYLPCTAHPPWIYHSNNIWWAVQVKSSSLCSVLQALIISSLFWNTLNCRFIEISDQFFSRSQYFLI